MTRSQDLDNQIASQQNHVNSLYKRKGEVEAIVNYLKTGFCDNEDDLQKYTKGLIDRLRAGMNGIRSVENIVNSLETIEEMNPDPDLEFAKSFLLSESSDVNTKIQNEESEINSLKWQRDEAKAEEDAESNKGKSPQR